MLDVSHNNNLSADSSNLALLHDGLGDNIREGPSGQVLHDHPEVVVHHVGLDKVDQVLVLQLLHHLLGKITNKYCSA